MSTTIIPDPIPLTAPYRELGNQYAMKALRERRAFMTGELVKLDDRRRQLEESLEHLDATLAMLAPDFDPTLVKARFTRRKFYLFGAGKLNAMILNVMRKAEGPIAQRKVVTGVRIEAGRKRRRRG